jgi:hypothetical protein
MSYCADWFRLFYRSDMVGAGIRQYVKLGKLKQRLFYLRLVVCKMLA